MYRSPLQGGPFSDDRHDPTPAAILPSIMLYSLILYSRCKRRLLRQLCPTVGNSRMSLRLSKILSRIERPHRCGPHPRSLCLARAVSSNPFRKASYAVLLVLALALSISGTALCETNIAVIPTPAVELRNDHYISNREPLVPSTLIKLPVGSVKPRGWLLETLVRQRDGLTGRLPEVSAWLEKEGNAWLTPDGRGKWGWEEVPYWLRGAASLATSPGRFRA